MTLKSRILVASIALLGFINAATTSAQSGPWRSFGPTGGSIDVLALDPNDSSTLYAGSRGGAFKSAASGAAWRPINEGIGRVIVSRLAVDPRQPSRLFATTLTPPGFFRSTDAGETWQRVEGFHLGPSSFVFDPSDNSTTYAAADEFFRSTDGGATWEAAPGDRPGSVRALVISPSHPNRHYGSFRFSGIFRSLDGGLTWLATPLTEDHLNGLAVDPLNPDIVLTHGADVVYRSVNGGRSWRKSPQPSSAPEFFKRILADPRGTGSFYLVTDRRVYVTRDQGSSWRPFGETPPDSANDLAIANDGNFYLATLCGIFRSLGGGPWMNASGQLKAVEVRSLTTDPTNPGILYAGTLACGRYRSVDGGVRWQRLEAPASTRTSLGMAIDPESPANRWYTATRQGLFTTVNGGRSWKRIPADPTAAFTLTTTYDQVAIAPSDVETVFAIRNSRLFRSVDRGARFTEVEFGDGLIGAQKSHLQVRSLAIDPTDSATVYTARGHLLKSTDRGESWRLTGEGLRTPRALAVDRRDPNTLYALGNVETNTLHRVSKSEDGGETWRETSPEEFSDLTAMALDQNLAETIYVGTRRNGVFVSTDGSQTWRSLGEAGAIDFARAIQATDTALFVGTHRGVLELAKDCGGELVAVGTGAVTLGAGFAPAVAVDGGGRFLAAWTEPNGGAVARAVNAGTFPLSEIFPLGNSTDGSPAIAANGPGEVLAVWQRDSAGSTAVRSRLFGIGGRAKGAVVRVDREPRRLKLNPAVVRTGVGEAVVVWESISSQQRSLIRAQRFDAGGVVTGQPISVRGDVDRVQWPDVGVDAFGRFSITWLELQSQELSVRLRRYTVRGQPRDPVIRLSGAGARVVEAPPRLAVASTGESVALWLQEIAGGERQLTILWRDNLGQTVVETRIGLGAETIAGYDVDIDRLGNTLVVFSMGNTVRAQLFDGAFQPRSEEVEVGAGGSPKVALDLAGGAVVVWENAGVVRARRLRLGCVVP